MFLVFPPYEHKNMKNEISRRQGHLCAIVLLLVISLCARELCPLKGDKQASILSRVRFFSVIFMTSLYSAYDLQGSCEQLVSVKQKVRILWTKKDDIAAESSVIGLWII